MFYTIYRRFPRSIGTRASGDRNISHQHLGYPDPTGRSRKDMKTGTMKTALPT